jgi:hypothetical protein
VAAVDIVDLEADRAIAADAYLVAEPDASFARAAVGGDLVLRRGRRLLFRGRLRGLRRQIDTGGRRRLRRAGPAQLLQKRGLRLLQGLDLRLLLLHQAGEIGDLGLHISVAGLLSHCGRRKQDERARDEKGGPHGSSFLFLL